MSPHFTEPQPDSLADWIPPWREAQHAREQALAAERRRARASVAEAVAATLADRAARPVDPDEPERSLGELARKRAALMLDRITDLCEPVTAEWLAEQMQALEGGALPPIDPESPVSVADQLAGLVKRATEPRWWRRALRKAATRKRERAAAAAGRIGKHAGTLYVTRDTYARHAHQQAKNRQTLERTEIESEDGERITLAQAADASTANPALRRGELMTRIKGCEQWATLAGLVGDFATLTTPSRFHPMLFKGGQNPKHDPDLDPKAGQAWLCKQWGRTRTALARHGLRIFGFRVAEPHHDGTPHWHALWWTRPEDAESVRELVAHYWLADSGREAGAGKHRAKFERIKASKGGALAYVSKYIAKGIDDAGAVGDEGHDEAEPADAAKLEGARRVRTWASAHGIRQFQAFGQPPVTAWRELRRLAAVELQGEAVAGRGASLMAAAFDAVNRDGERRACWRGYMEAQGGAMLARDAYRIRIESEEIARAGVYGPTLARRPLGLRAIDSQRLYRTDRKEWRPRGTWGDPLQDLADAWGAGAWAVLGYDESGAPVRVRMDPEVNSRDTSGSGQLSRHRPMGAAAGGPAVHPWTRVNNCTDQHPDALRPLGALPGQSMRPPARMGWRAHQSERPGGHQPERNPPCPPSPPLT